MALSANASLQKRATRFQKTVSLVIKTSVVVYKDALVATSAAGLAVVEVNATSQKSVGIAIADSSGTTAGFPITGNGTRTVVCGIGLEVLMPLKTSVTVSLVGDKMYAFDDATITNLATVGSQVGTLREFVAANSGWVALGAQALDGAS